MKVLKEQVNQFRQTFIPIFNRPVQIQFGEHTFTVTITDIVKARLADLVNKPERREAPDGTFYTPTVVTFLCGEEKIHMYLDDIVVITSGVFRIRITFVNDMIVTFTWNQ